MKIVLTRPKYNSHIITPPLGLGYLASYLKKNGVTAVIIDGLRDKLTHEELLRRVLSENPDAVGITCLTSFYKESIELSLLLKENNVRCILGGSHPTFLPYQTLIDSNADYVIAGEGENALLQLVKNNFANNEIQGIYSRDNLKNSKSPIQKAKVVENLDDIPFPDWTQINPNLYPKAPHGAIVKRFPVGVIVTSRGCPYECSFCSSPKFYDRKIRFRTPENVVQEIKYLFNNFGVREIHFEDDNLTLKRSHIVKICELIIENKLDICWSCPNGIRADMIDEELAALMARSGCYNFVLGIESANSDILRNIKKKETIAVVSKAIEIAEKNGITCQGFFIFGLPGETKETIDETINFALKSRLSGAQFLILDVLPGSELWETLRGRFRNGIRTVIESQSGFLKDYPGNIS